MKAVVVLSILALVAQNSMKEARAAETRPHGVCIESSYLRRIEQNEPIQDIGQGSTSRDRFEQNLALLFRSWAQATSRDAEVSAPAVRRTSDEAAAEVMGVVVRCGEAKSPAGIFLAAVRDNLVVIDDTKLMLRIQEKFDTAADEGVWLGYLGSAAISYRLKNELRARKALEHLKDVDHSFTDEKVGIMLFEGVVFERNPSAAYKWLVAAGTNANSAMAQHALVRMFLTGDGVPADEKAARYWLDLLEKNPDASRDYAAERELEEKFKSQSNANHLSSSH